MKKLIILQTVLPDYRKKFFSFIKEELGKDFDIYGGDFYFEESIQSDKSILFTKKVRNFYLFGRRALFQTGMWNIILQNNILVLEMNPRIISNWLILLIRKMINRKTILWGHAWSRSGAHSKKDKLRNSMRILGDTIIVYTETQKKELELKMPNKSILAAPNAIFYKNEMNISRSKKLITNIIYVGRLTIEKKVLILVEAFHQAIEKLPKNASLLIIGAGEEEDKIKIYIINHNLSSRIKLLGHIGSYDKLNELYSTSITSVSPGYIGLSVIQSFGFGVPMIVSRIEQHSPEIEAVIENENAMFFKTDKIESLSQVIVNFYEQKEYWIDKRLSICNFCRENYSVEAMAKSFINLYR